MGAGDVENHVEESNDRSEGDEEDLQEDIEENHAEMNEGIEEETKIDIYAEEDEVEKVMTQFVTLGLVLSVTGLQQMFPTQQDGEGAAESAADQDSGLRFRFLLPGMEEPHVTEIVENWQRVHIDEVDPLASTSDETSEDNSNPELQPEEDKLTDANDLESKNSSGKSTKAVQAPPPYTSSFATQIRVDLSWARALDKSPHLVLTGFAGENEPWLGCVSLDLSPLLDGKQSIVHTWGSYPGTENQYVAEEELFNRRIKSLKVQVVSSEPCLTEDLAEVVNPLSITLMTVRPLPGLIVEKGNATLQPYVTDPITKTQDPFLLQKRYCEPVHAQFKVLPRLLGDHRCVQTSGFRQGPNKVVFSTSTTVLLGELDRDLVAEALETDPVHVFLQDRDVPLVSTDRLWKEFNSSIKGRFKALDAVVDETASIEAGANAPEVDEDGEMKLTPAMRRQYLDFQICTEQVGIRARHAAQQARGEAKFSLAELWTSSTELVDRHRADLYLQKPERFGPNRKVASFKARSGVTPVKRTCQLHPDDKKAELDLSDAERMVRQPGQYMEAGTEVRLAAHLTFPVHHHERSFYARKIRAKRELERREALFERVVFLFEYKSGALMQELCAVLRDVNARALPHAVSLRSHQLSEKESALADSGELDILTGFQVVDDQFRVVVIEGLANGGVEELVTRIPRRAANTEQLRILRNTEVRFSKRLYTCFDVDLKIIRLRDSLCYITQAAEIYDSFKVDEDCHNALCRLSEIRSMHRTRILFRASLFPTPEMLTKLESKYGESVSVEDMDGVPKQARRPRRGQNQIEDQQGLGEGQLVLNSNQDIGDSGAASPSRSHSAGTLRRKAATDSRNDAFLASLAAREEKDFLAENRRIRQRIKRSTKARLDARSDKDQALLAALGQKGKQIYMYSGQKLNFVEMQQDHLRQRLAGNKNVTYTYSEEYQSLAFPLVNEERVAKLEAQANQAKFITERGFVYPAPRESSEARKGRRDVSEARVEELKQPWEDPSALRRLTRSESEIDFDCIPTNDFEVFGGYNKDGSRNPDFFKSVHLSGDGVEAEAKERKAQEHQDWLDRVVVDTLDFKAHQGSKGDKPSQLDKLRDILDSKPKKKGIYMVRNATLPSGKRVPLRVPPVSIMGPSEH